MVEAAYLKVSFGARVANNSVLGILVLVVVVQVLKEYVMIIGCLDPSGFLIQP